MCLRAGCCCYTKARRELQGRRIPMFAQSQQAPFSSRSVCFAFRVGRRLIVVKYREIFSRFFCCQKKKRAKTTTLWIFYFHLWIEKYKRFTMSEVVSNVVQFFTVKVTFASSDTDIKLRREPKSESLLCRCLSCVKKPQLANVGWLRSSLNSRPKETVFHVAAYNMLLFISRYDFVALDGNVKFAWNLSRNCFTKTQMLGLSWIVMSKQNKEGSRCEYVGGGLEVVDHNFSMSQRS